MNEMNEQEELVIELRRPTMRLGLAVPICGGLAWFMIDRALDNDRGLIINGIIHLGPEGASIFYAVLGGGMLIFLLAALSALWGLSRRRHFRIVFGPEDVTLPHSQLWRTNEDRRIRIKDILIVHSPSAGVSNPFVHIDTHHGRVAVSGRWLPPEWPPRALAREIVRRIRSWQEAGRSEEPSTAGISPEG